MAKPPLLAQSSWQRGSCHSALTTSLLVRSGVSRWQQLMTSGFSGVSQEGGGTLRSHSECPRTKCVLRLMTNGGKLGPAAFILEFSPHRVSILFWSHLLCALTQVVSQSWPVYFTIGLSRNCLYRVVACCGGGAEWDGT